MRPMRQQKIAISLALVAAIATLFASGTYKPTGTYGPLSKAKEAEMRSILTKTNNCQTNVDSGVQRDPHDAFSGFDGLIDPFTCKNYLELLAGSDHLRYDFSLTNYLATNAAAAAVAFAAIFGLSYLLPALARQYWRWLNT